MKPFPRRLRDVTLGLLITTVCAIGTPPASAAESPRHDDRPLFDPQRHMRVAEVRPGMKGYGLSVFMGTKIERFEVEVISILRNFNPKYDVVLIKCHGANLELTGAVAGMSGSPVFLKDDAGRERMIGAFAYGWPMTKEPLAGVQPIEYMLTLPSSTKPPAESVHSAARTNPGPTEAGARFSWSLPKATGWPKVQLLPQETTSPSPTHSALTPTPKLSADPPATRLQPLATPLMVGGISPA